MQLQSGSAIVRSRSMSAQPSSSSENDSKELQQTCTTRGVVTEPSAASVSSLSQEEIWTPAVDAVRDAMKLFSKDKHKKAIASLSVTTKDFPDFARTQ